MSLNWVKANEKVINTVSNFIIAIVAIVGLISGIVAYRHYKVANEIAYNNTLETTDNRLYDMALENNKYYLLRVLYYSPPDNLSQRIRANLYFQSLFDNDISIKWETIPELTDYYLNNINIIRTNDGNRVAEAILNFERLLILCQNILSNEKMLNGSGWDNYANAYIDDYKNNPYFLAALHVDHSLGYINKDFSAYLLSRIRNSPMIKEIYPEMLLPNWLDKYGKGKQLN